MIQTTEQQTQQKPIQDTKENSSVLCNWDALRCSEPHVRRTPFFGNYCKTKTCQVDRSDGHSKDWPVTLSLYQRSIDLTTIVFAQSFSLDYLLAVLLLLFYSYNTTYFWTVIFCPQYHTYEIISLLMDQLGWFFSHSCVWVLNWHFLGAKK